MKTSLKPIAQQTIVITGASSGIGLAAAQAAAARVVFASGRAVQDGRVRGDHPSIRHSTYTKAAIHPTVTAALLGIAGAAVGHATWRQVRH